MAEPTKSSTPPPVDPQVAAENRTAGITLLSILAVVAIFVWIVGRNRDAEKPPADGSTPLTALTPGEEALAGDGAPETEPPADGAIQIEMPTEPAAGSEATGEPAPAEPEAETPPAEETPPSEDAPPADGEGESDGE